VIYEDGSASTVVVNIDGQVIVTNDGDSGVQINGRLQPETGSNPSGWQFNLVDEKVTTRMTSSVTAGATKIQVSSIAGFAMGSEIIIDAGMPTEETNRIKGFGSILLEAPLTFDHNVGASVSASNSSEQYLFKIQNGRLVVHRLAASTWVKGTGELQVADDKTNERSLATAVIVIIAGVLGGLGIAVGSVLFYRRRRTLRNKAPTLPVQIMGQVSTKFEQGAPPKLLGALQSSSFRDAKKSRDSFPTSGKIVAITNLENALESARRETCEDTELSNSDNTELSNMVNGELALNIGDKEVADYQGREVEEITSDSSCASIPGDKFELTIADI
jgi:hypothetical protein